MLDIIHALTTDGVKLVIAINATRNMTVIAFIFRFEMFFLVKIIVIPVMIYPTCVKYDIYYYLESFVLFLLEFQKYHRSSIPLVIFALSPRISSKFDFIFFCIPFMTIKNGFRFFSFKISGLSFAFTIP